MARAKMIVLAQAPEGHKADLDEWYETRHVPDLLGVPGIQSIERYDLRVLKGPPGTQAWDFIGIYEIEAEDVNAVLKEAASRMGTAQMPASPHLDSSKTLALIATERKPG